ncbi:hypothetical protein XU18_1888 [Perkinsela sp. CCAP 1560/4]|nr:hypothetical protein XU18_1888 [Perkinsela sp. CCAP 1560/4]|eukprot:KNH07356.1 hypothetical protein XU18_1888 [Perkinsela sp. CCAP 1560/4]
MHAHTFQVFGSPALALVVNGCPVEHFHENDVPTMSLFIKNENELCHVMFFSMLNKEVKVICNNRVMGVMKPYHGMISFEIFEPAVVRFVYCDTQILKEVEQELIDIFHDVKINPSFGAVQMSVLRSEMLKRCPNFADAILSFPFYSSPLLHCYEGKDKLQWVVLHSHRKKVNIPADRATEYSLLLKYLIGELLISELPLNELFRKIYRESNFCRLLSSNFTVLKKLLIKFNSEFLWFQDLNSKTTKVIMHDSPTIRCR